MKPKNQTQMVYLKGKFELPFKKERATVGRLEKTKKQIAVARKTNNKPYIYIDH